jgi:type III secretory pathway component EscV
MNSDISVGITATSANITVEFCVLLSVLFCPGEMLTLFKIVCLFVCLFQCLGVLFERGKYESVSNKNNPCPQTSESDKQDTK